MVQKSQYRRSVLGSISGFAEGSLGCSLKAKAYSRRVEAAIITLSTMPGAVDLEAEAEGDVSRGLRESGASSPPLRLSEMPIVKLPNLGMP